MSTDLSCKTGQAPGTAGHTDLAPPAPGHTLHGVTLRPPVLHWNGTRYCGSHLQDISTQAALQVPGVTDVVVHNHFIGVVASQLAQARHARAQLSVRWVHPVTGSQPATALSDNGAAPDHNENSFYQPDPAIGPQQTWQWHATDTAEPAWAIAQRTG